ALKVPLAIVYDVAQPPSAGVRSRWELTADIVLPCGAKLCLRARAGGGYHVLTCYFTTEARADTTTPRWRTLVRELLRRYVRTTATGRFRPRTSRLGRVPTS